MKTESKIEAVLLDLDGVLVDSIDCWLKAFNETLKKYGMSEIAKADFLKKRWGLSTEENFSNLGLGRDAVRYCHSRHMRLVSEVKLMPNAKETLAAMRGKVKVGLITNTPRENTKNILAHFGLSRQFDVVLTGEDVEEKKPHPAMILKACELLGVEPSKTLIVGDTETDIRAGKAAGCLVVGFGIPGDFTIKNLSELVSFLGI